MTTDVEISPEVAGHVLWHFSGGGYRPGDFTACLLDAFDRADPGNFARLRRGFPEYAAAFTLARDTAEGVAQLQARLREITQGADNAD